MEIEASTWTDAGRRFLDALGIGGDPVESAERARSEEEAVAPKPFWKIIARVEGDESDFDEEERLTPAILRQIVETFDPDRRRVPWISGFVEGSQTVPAHFSANPPTAEVEALSFDGMNLWARSTARLDPDTGANLFQGGVDRGLTERSIGFDEGSNETDGAAQLLHVAQMSQAEQPGIANMPRLDRASHPSPSYRSRAWARTPGEEIDLMSVELSEESLEAIRGMTDSAIATGIAPVVERLDGIESRVGVVEERTTVSAEEEQAATEAAEVTAETEAEEERTRVRDLVHGYYTEAVQSGRAPAAIQEILRVFPADPTGAQAEQIRVSMNAITPLDRAGSPILHEVRAANGQPVNLPANAFRVIGTGANPDPAQMETLAEAYKAATAEDGTISLRELRAQIYRSVGERLPASGNFAGRLRP